MTLRYATMAAACFASLTLGGVAMAGGAPAPRGGPAGGPCIAPHPICKMVNGRKVCTKPKPVKGCAGG